MSGSSFDPNALGDLSSKTFVITGANTGIGFEAAKLLAKARGRVYLGCRDPNRGERARAAIVKDAPSSQVEVFSLDLANLGAVRTAAASLLERLSSIDVVINNAGVMALPRRLTADGFEMQFGTNHLGHFAFTGLLLPAVLRAPAGRVVTVSSSLHVRGRVDFDDLNGERRYNEWTAYAQSKLCNLFFAYELERRLRQAGSRAISLACHPGYAATELQERGPQMTGSKFGAAMMKIGNSLFAQSAEAGSWPTVFAAVSAEARGMDYIGPMGIGHMWGKPGKNRSNRLSHDEAQARRLWEVSERMTGVEFASLRAAA